MLGVLEVATISYQKIEMGEVFPGRFGWGVHPPQTFEVKVVKNF